jgi:hypothetical protein
VRTLVWIVMLASAYGAVQWYLHERPIAHPPGMLAADTPQIVLGSNRLPWQDAHGYSYTPRAHFDARVVVLARANYHVGEFATFSPTDLAIAWGPLSDRSIYEQFRFDERGTPLAGRFVFPEIRAGSDMAKLPFDQVNQFLVRNLTHVHTIPGDGVVAKVLAGVRPGQLIHMQGVLVDTVAPSRDQYRTSLQLFDHECEIMVVDSITLE